MKYMEQESTIEINARCCFDMQSQFTRQKSNRFSVTSYNLTFFMYLFYLPRFYLKHNCNFNYSTGFIVTKRDMIKITTKVLATKQVTKIYQVSSSNTSVNAGTWLYSWSMTFRLYGSFFPIFNLFLLALLLWFGFHSGRSIRWWS